MSKITPETRRLNKRKKMANQSLPRIICAKVYFTMVHCEFFEICMYFFGIVDRPRAHVSFTQRRHPSTVDFVAAALAPFVVADTLRPLLLLTQRSYQYCYHSRHQAW